MERAASIGASSGIQRPSTKTQKPFNLEPKISKIFQLEAKDLKNLSTWSQRSHPVEGFGYQAGEEVLAKGSGSSVPGRKSKPACVRVHLPRFQELCDSRGKVVGVLRRETEQNAGGALSSGN